MNELEWHYQILFEDKNLMVINKLGYYPLQSNKKGEQGLLSVLRQRALIYESASKIEHYQFPHRLDQPVTGAVILAKTQETLSKLNRMFQERKIAKYYWAVTSRLPHPLEGELVHYLVHHQRINKTKAYWQPVPKSQEAILQYKYLFSSERYHFLEIRPLTGRHHQIRAQLAAIGAPIKGDIKYGAERSNPEGGIMLHAYQIAFEHPIQRKYIQIKALPPQGNVLWEYLLQHLDFSHKK
ncbi:MAG: RNA pseudouridine synthase [Cytophagales bacterium]|nr:RNA pseudouridine synthase [Cytophagales bacterium]MDW8383629.1 RNA pseudouridine synthase [Flammeovirgaceae bacterium]